ncbi:MAG: aromatic amino acid transport family protein [Corynebacterium aurimucosum]|uniref:aromatic amino acid transport family protein n=1 Tax=Corynebacterium TaxID=1716 RepID=UPI0008A6562C|nr:MULTISPECIES: aromatic amino acid transport family protein [Corynebacterium]MBU5654637.1 amino acid permease [Corynebacterium aurimucosum]OFL24434.1 septum formation initiator [Corynebacterium sp. HMSC062A03]
MSSANTPPTPSTPPTTELKEGEHIVGEGDAAKQRPAASTASWIITLFGTAVGAGILFLPLNAGGFGFWPLVFATVFILPLVYFSHRTYARIVAGAPKEDHGKDILELVSQYLGKGQGIGFAVLYWITVFSTVLIYGVSITNAVDSFIVNQLGGPSIDRWLLATICVGIMTGGFAIGRKPMIWLAQVLVYPLIIALAITSIYLIPRWDLHSFIHFDDGADGWGQMLKGIFLILPVLVFSFSHMAALSQFAIDMQPQYGEKTEKRVSRTEFYTAILLVVFTMFFVWSCVLALGADGMNEALEQNIPVLSYFANVTGTPFMAYMAPIVVICAIVSSYFGHMLGTEEGTEYLLKNAAPQLAEKVSHRTLLNIIYVIVFVCTTLVAIFNPSIISMISVVSGVFVAFIVYLVPVYMFKKLDVYKQFRNDPWNYFVFGMGLLIMAVTIWDMI